MLPGRKKNSPANRFTTLDIRTGAAVISGTRYNFAATPLLDGKLQMIIPEDFQSVPPEKFYKPESKPDLMLTDQSGAIQITLLHTKKEVTTEAEVASHKNEVRQILEGLNSNLDWQGNDIKEVNDRRIEYFELTTPVLGSLVYNLTFFMQLQQRILTGSFICTERHLKGWKPVFHQMLESIKVTTPETVNTVLTRPDYSTYPFKSGQYGFHNGQEYRLYKVEADKYSLISHNPQDLENGFVAKDGVFRKIVTKSEITAAYEIQLTILYRGHRFEFAGQGIQSSRIKLLAKNCSPAMIKELQLEKVDANEYMKIIDITEVENVIERRLPAAVSFQNTRLFIYEATSFLENGVIKHLYLLAPQKGLSQKTVYNEEIVGLSLEGKVIDVAKDKVRVHLTIDPEQKKEEAFWFPYSSVYTAEGNSGWYCMPELGDWVRIYFGSKKEEEGVAISSVRKDSSESKHNKLPDPNTKYFRTKSGKELMFSPAEIVITGKDDQIYIKLNDKDGITIYSQKAVKIIAKQDLTMESEEAKVIIKSKEGINISCDSSELKMDKTSVVITGDEVRFAHCQLNQADFSDAILHDADFRGANLQQAVFFGVEGAQGIASDADLNIHSVWGVNFSGANLEGANFRYANLQGANFNQARFNRFTNFDGARLQQAVFNQAARSYLKLEPQQVESIIWID